MTIDLRNVVDILSRTPQILNAILGGAVNDPVSSGDREDWSPFDVVGHLIHGEQTDWIPRAEIILAGGNDPRFVPFDRVAQFEHSEGKSLEGLLEEFASLRKANLKTLNSWALGAEELALTGIHPDFGEVTLAQLLSTWAVHDLNHIRQIVTLIAKPLSSDVGPWKEYLFILEPRK